jgi:large subunit ribosomal protein L9
MEVILLERIERLGQMGEVVKVKSGYARNFLLPQKKAMRATEDNKKVFEEQRAQLETVNLERRSDAESVAAKMDGHSVTLIRQAGEAGQLYGSVSARDIADAATESGFTVERQQVKLAPPIKSVGVHAVRVDLHPEVSVTVMANVARSAEEAKIQATTGEAVVHRDEEERRPIVAEQPAEEAAPAEAEAADEAEAAAEETSSEASDEAESEDSTAPADDAKTE